MFGMFDLRSLPRDLSTSFYKLLKTLLFGRARAGSASEYRYTLKGRYIR